MVKLKEIKYGLKLYFPESTDIIVRNKGIVVLLRAPWTIILFHKHRTLVAAIPHHPTRHSTKYHKSPETGRNSLHENIGKQFPRTV